MIRLINHIGLDKHLFTVLQLHLLADLFVLLLVVILDVYILVVFVEMVFLVVKERVVHLLVPHLALQALSYPCSEISQLHKSHQGVI